MARIRTIKPGFFTSEHVASVQPLARLLFIGLWTEADRCGKLIDRPRQLKVKLLPYDECDCDALLSELEEAELIERYMADGIRVISIPKFQKHQRPNVKEVDSDLPEMDEHEKNRADTERNGPIREGKGREQEGKGTERETYAQEFELLWQACAKKRGKGSARRAYVKAKKRGCPQVSNLIAILSELQRTHDWTKDGRQYQPYLASWLNDDGWEDRVAGAGSSTAPRFAVGDRSLDGRLVCVEVSPAGQPTWREAE